MAAFFVLCRLPDLPRRGPSPGSHRRSVGPSCRFLHRVHRAVRLLAVPLAPGRSPGFRRSCDCLPVPIVSSGRSCVRGGRRAWPAGGRESGAERSARGSNVRRREGPVKAQTTRCSGCSDPCSTTCGCWACFAVVHAQPTFRGGLPTVPGRLSTSRGAVVHVSLGGCPRSVHGLTERVFYFAIHARRECVAPSRARPMAASRRRVRETVPLSLRANEWRDTCR